MAAIKKRIVPAGVLDSMSEQIHLVTSEGVVNELLEVQIRTAERFYTNAWFGSTAVEIRGELKAPDDTGKHMITIRSRVTEFTGELTTTDGKIVEDSNSMSSSTSFYITVGEPLWIGNIGLSPKPKGIVPSARTLEHNIMFVTLEPAKNETLGK